MGVVIAVIVAGLLVAGLVFSGVLSFSGQAARLGAELRELLLQRAAGKIDEEEFGRRQAALHAALMQRKPASGNRLLWWGIPVAVAFAAVGYYLTQEKPQAIDVKPAGPMGARFGSGEAPKAASSPSAGQANSGGDLGAMAKRLAEKLAKDPGNGEGWLLLARTYNELRQPKEAAAAYAKAAAQLPLDASMLADWADAHVMANGRKWDAEARKIVQRAVGADPKHLKSLALAGSEAFERADYKAAIGYWKRMKAVAPADSMDAKLADANIHEAEAMISGKRPASADGAAAAPPRPGS